MLYKISRLFAYSHRVWKARSDHAVPSIIHGQHIAQLL